MDGIELLKQIPDSKISACFFDPQYREVMEKLKYGNEGARQKKRALLPQMSTSVIISFLEEISRVLKPSSYLFIWADKFIIAEGVHSTWFIDRPIEDELKLVDLITWDKGRMGMGYRSRRTNEFLLVYQKAPKTTKNWKDKGIRDTFSEKIENPRTGHAHRKPLLLTERLINCVTNENDYVLDPCSGSFSTLTCCEKINRNFIGCDISPEYGEVLPE